LIIFIL